MAEQFDVKGQYHDTAVLIDPTTGLPVVFGGAAQAPASQTIVGYRGAGTARNITATTTAQSLVAANTSRNGLIIVNDSTIDVWINIGSTATAVAGAGNIRIAAGGRFQMDPVLVDTGAISVIAASGTVALTVREY